MAGVLVLFALWCLLWVMSSSSMAFTDCAGTYELFSPNPRCRQPAVAGLLGLASVIGAVAAMVFGWRLRK
jgi:hypothetical protein